MIAFFVADLSNENYQVWFNFNTSKIEKGVLQDSFIHISFKYKKFLYTDFSLAFHYFAF